MLAYIEVSVRASGTALTATEKFGAIAQKLNDRGRKEGWPEVTARIVDRKMDTMKRKGKKVYKTFKKRPHTGAPVDEDLDLEVRKSEMVYEWCGEQNFMQYFGKLSFRNRLWQVSCRFKLFWH